MVAFQNGQNFFQPKNYILKNEVYQQIIKIKPLISQTILYRIQKNDKIKKAYLELIEDKLIIFN